MPFQREAIHANGSGKSNLDNGGNMWVYSPTNGDSLLTIQGANFFLPFQEALEVNDLILIAIGSTTLTHSAVSVSNATTVTIVSPVVNISIDSLSIPTSTDPAISILTDITEITTTGGASTSTLADGFVGQKKIIVMVADAGDNVLTPNLFGGGTTITFAAPGEAIELLFATTVGWVILGGTAAIA